MQLIVYTVDFIELQLYFIPVHLGSIVPLVHSPCELIQTCLFKNSKLINNDYSLFRLSLI
jgi:hypothetical protein